MSLAGSASDHQGSRIHEAGPKATRAGDELFKARAQAGEQILVDHENWLDGGDGALVLDDQIAVSEPVLERVFEKLVEAMIFSLAGERSLPAGGTDDLVPESNPDCFVRTRYRGVKHRVPRRCAAITRK